MTPKDMLIDNKNEKVASTEERMIWKILGEYGVNPMAQPNCADEIIELVNKLFIQRVSNFNFEDFAKAILSYDYNKLISGKVAVCEKDSNSIIVSYDTKEECYNWVLQNYCC